MFARQLTVRNRIGYRAKYQPLHSLRSIDKVKNLINHFNKEMAVPIIVGNNGNLINGTHRYSAYLIRKKKGLKDNFPIVYLSELECWVGDAIRDYLENGDNSKYIDIDSFWRDNWEFSDWYSANEEVLFGSAFSA